MMLTHDKPSCKGMENMLKRARRFTDFTWYGLKPIPTSDLLTRNPKLKSERQDTFLAPYAPQTGLLYSACLHEEKYIGFTVNLETFVTAAMNPNSVLYTNNLHLGGGSCSCFYGMVCSAFVSYVSGMQTRINCKDWAENPMVTEMKNLAPEDFRLGDILDKVQAEHSHIVMISDIVRDENGRVHSVEISECTPPACVRRPYSREQFMAWFFEAEPFKVYRLNSFDHITYEPNPYMPVGHETAEGAIDFQLMTNFGHNASVRLHEELIELSLLKGDWDEFVVTLPDGSTKTYPAGQKVKVDCMTVGHYSAVCKKGETTSDAVCWHVHNIKIKSDKLIYKVGEPITLTFENAENDEVFLCRVNALPTSTCRAWANVSGTKGTVTIPGVKVPSNCWAMVTAQGEGCQYTSGKYYFEIVE